MRFRQPQAAIMVAQSFRVRRTGTPLAALEWLAMQFDRQRNLAAPRLWRVIKTSKISAVECKRPTAGIATVRASGGFSTMPVRNAHVAEPLSEKMPYGSFSSGTRIRGVMLPSFIVSAISEQAARP